MTFCRTLFAIAVTLITSPLMAQTDLPFTLDWKIEGSAAPYFYALDVGYFAQEDLNVTISAGTGSKASVPKVASGEFPVGIADINALMRYLDQTPDAPVIAVMMIYDKPPFAVVGRKSQGVNTPSDLEGRTLGAPPPDGAWAQFPIFAAANDIDVSTITIDPVSFALRETMLVAGNVDAVTGFSYSSTLSAIHLGADPEDLSVMLMADHGVDLYGNAIIVNTDFATANPDVITGFLRAVAKGWKDAIAAPPAAIAGLIVRNPRTDFDLETQRLQMAIDGNVLTEFVIENGMGSIDDDRMRHAIEQTKSVYQFQHELNPASFFDPSYLPTDGSLNLQ